MEINTNIESTHYKEFLFTATDTAENWKCDLCGKIIKVKPKTGASNFKAHINSKGARHEQAIDVIRARQKQGRETALANLNVPVLVDAAAKQVFGWIEWIVMGFLPFSFVEKTLTRKYSKLQQISIKTLKKHMENLVVVVEEKIASLLPNKFGIVVDGWSDGGTHFVAIYATYLNQRELPVQSLLACSPMGNETRLDGQTFIEFLADTLAVFRKPLDSVIFMVSDNTELNPSICRKLRIPFVGCMSHRLALAVKHYLDNSCGDLKFHIENIQKIMVRLSAIKMRAQLRLTCHLAPVLLSATRWDGLLRMLDRYFENSFYEAVKRIAKNRKSFKSKASHEEFLDLMPDDDEVDDCANTEGNDHVGQLRRLRDDLSIVNELSKHLQTEDLSLLDAYTAIDEAPIKLSHNPDLISSIHRYCSHDSVIVAESAHFTEAVCKMLENQSAVTELTQRQMTLLAPFKQDTAPCEIEPVNVSPVKETDTLSARLAKKRKLREVETERRRHSSSATLFRGLETVIPTSNVCERLFSKANLVFRLAKVIVTPNFRNAVVPDGQP